MVTNTQIPTGYKQTDIGVIPQDWEVMTVDQVAKVKGGKRVPKGKSLTDRETSHPYIKVSDMTTSGSISTDDIQYVPEDVFPTIRNYRIFKDDIYISVAGTLGLVGFIPEKLDGANLTENADRLTDIQCDKRYLYHFLSSPAIQKLIESMRTMGAQPKLALTRINKFSLVIPTNEKEQEKIAQSLDDIDTFISTLDELIEKKHNIKLGTMQELLTGKQRLPGFSGEWGKVAICKLTKIPVSDGPHLTPEFLDDGIPFLSVNNLVNNKVDLKDLRYISRKDHEEFSKKCRPQKNDILLGKAASVGLVAVVDFDFEFNIWSPIAVIRLKEEHMPRYVYYLFQTRYVSDQIKLFTNSSSQGNLGMGDIEKIEILVPKKNEQIAIAEALEDIDMEIELLENKRNKYVNLKQGMMQQLLTGKIRLI